MFVYVLIPLLGAYILLRVISKKRLPFFKDFIIWLMDSQIVEFFSVATSTLFGLLISWLCVSAYYSEKRNIFVLVVVCAAVSEIGERLIVSIKRYL
jgi:hypothetical protein